MSLTFKYYWVEIELCFKYLIIIIDRFFNFKNKSIPFVDYFRVFPLEKTAHFLLARQNGGDQLSCDLLFSFVGIGVIPFLQAQLSLPAKQQNKLNLLLNIFRMTLKQVKTNMNAKSRTFTIRSLSFCFDLTVVVF